MPAIKSVEGVKTPRGPSGLLLKQSSRRASVHQRQPDRTNRPPQRVWMEVIGPLVYDLRRDDFHLQRADAFDFAFDFVAGI